MGVEVHTNTPVTKEDAEGIVVREQIIPAGTVLWGAGVLATGAARWLKVETDKSGKIVVGQNQSVPGHSEIFAIGDTAHVFGRFSALPRRKVHEQFKEQFAKRTKNNTLQDRISTSP